MFLNDMILRAKVNHALGGEPALKEHHIEAKAKDGAITLTGSVAQPELVERAKAVARSIVGVGTVENETTYTAPHIADSAEEVSQMFLDKLEAEYKALPDDTALTQSDYVRWALWMTTKFHIPISISVTDRNAVTLETVEKALAQISKQTGLPKTQLALEMLRQAESISESAWRDAPETGTPGLVSSPPVTV